MGWGGALVPGVPSIYLLPWAPTCLWCFCYLGNEVGIG